MREYGSLVTIGGGLKFAGFAFLIVGGVAFLFLSIAIFLGNNEAGTLGWQTVFAGCLGAMLCLVISEVVQLLVNVAIDTETTKNYLRDISGSQKAVQPGAKPVEEHEDHFEMLT